LLDIGKVFENPDHAIDKLAADFLKGLPFLGIVE
jgi:hypothetical protein